MPPWVASAPQFDLHAGSKPVPVIVTSVPPAEEPASGSIFVTVGGSSG